MPQVGYRPGLQAGGLEVSRCDTCREVHGITSRYGVFFFVKVGVGFSKTAQKKMDRVKVGSHQTQATRFGGPVGTNAPDARLVRILP